MENVDHNAFLNINLNAIKDNYKTAKKKVKKNCIVAATVKANAYGLGIDKVASALTKAGCRNYFVATTNEAIELRKIDKKVRIFILNGLVAKDIQLISRSNLIPVINNLNQLKKIETFQKKINKRLSIALHFDTGMSRLGFDKSETEYLLKNKSNLIKRSKLLLVMSHLACADNIKSVKNEIQLKKFNEIKNHFPNSIHSLSNSAGILLGKKYNFDMVRPGISLYGGHCKLNEKNIYKNVVTLSAKIIQARKINKNDTIGYGATFKAKSKMIIGTIPIGYADGFNRLFSNKYHVLYKNKKINILGRISMDLTTIDLTKFRDNSNFKNEEVKIIHQKNTINNISKTINTIPYELLTSLGSRFTRRYKN